MTLRKILRKARGKAVRLVLGNELINNIMNLSQTNENLEQIKKNIDKHNNTMNLSQINENIDQLKKNIDKHNNPVHQTPGCNNNQDKMNLIYKMNVINLLKSTGGGYFWLFGKKGNSTYNTDWRFRFDTMYHS